eukprot:7310551-Pyramimonas_sp.AAC.2
MTETCQKCQPRRYGLIHFEILVAATRAVLLPSHGHRMDTYDILQPTKRKTEIDSDKEQATHNK